MKMISRIAVIVGLVMGLLAMVVAGFNPEPTKISLNKTECSIYLGESTQLFTTIEPRDLEFSLVKWESSNENVATVNSIGVVNTVAIGEVVISAKTTNNKKATCKVKVVPYPVSRVDLLYNYDYSVIAIGETASFSATAYPEDATYKTIVWSSSNPDVVSVDQSGNIVGLSAGQAEIFATADGVSSSHVITVKETIDVSEIWIKHDDLKLEIGDSFSLVAELLPGNVSNKSITWSSSDESVATVDQTGKVTAVNLGKVKITATANNGKSNSIDIEVVIKAKSIEIKGYEHLTKVNNKYTLTSKYLQLTCIISPDNTTYKDVEWSVSDFMGIETASISQNGYLTVLRYGIIRVTARIDGCVDTVEFYVPMGYD